MLGRACCCILRKRSGNGCHLTSLTRTGEMGDDPCSRTSPRLATAVRSKCHRAAVKSKQTIALSPFSSQWLPQVVFSITSERPFCQPSNPPYPSSFGHLAFACFHGSNGPFPETCSVVRRLKSPGSCFESGCLWPLSVDSKSPSPEANAANHSGSRREQHVDYQRPESCLRSGAGSNAIARPKATPLVVNEHRGGGQVFSARG